MIAIARRDDDRARVEARRAHEVDATLPMPQFVEGLIRYHAGDFQAAAPFLAQALQQSATRTVQIPELRYYLGDSLARLERFAEAEPVLRTEVRLFPYELRARAALAMLYRATGRIQESDREVATLERLATTSDRRTLVAQLRRMFRNR
jgi:tetratricopeptide (TPR) repeat protein